MKRESVRNSYIVLLTILTAISFIIVTDNIKYLEERISYIDSKRIELENKVEDLEQEKNYCEFSKEMLRKIHNKEVD